MLCVRDDGFGVLMDAVRLRDFRCFKGGHEAQLRPLTLLVGENSTGKTSLMALIRALWEVAYRHSIANFKEEPFDLGSFDDMAHRTDEAQADSFAGGFAARRLQASGSAAFSFDAVFTRSGTAPMPIERVVSEGDGSMKVTVRQKAAGDSVKGEVEVSDPAKLWKFDLEGHLYPGPGLTPLYYVAMALSRNAPQHMPESTEKQLHRLLDFPMGMPGTEGVRPFVSAPVRSRPRRTYDPALPSRDPQGEYIPTYLYEVQREGGETLRHLKKRLEDYGARSGLFHELNTQAKNALMGDPFQVHLKHTSEGPWRNLMDMGYGVNQSCGSAAGCSSGGLAVPVTRVTLSK